MPQYLPNNANFASDLFRRPDVAMGLVNRGGNFIDNMIQEQQAKQDQMFELAAYARGAPIQSVPRGGLLGLISPTIKPDARQQYLMEAIVRQKQDEDLTRKANMYGTMFDIAKVGGGATAMALAPSLGFGDLVKDPNFAQAMSQIKPQSELVQMGLQFKQDALQQKIDMDQQRLQEMQAWHESEDQIRMMAAQAAMDRANMSMFMIQNKNPVLMAALNSIFKNPLADPKITAQQLAALGQQYPEVLPIAQAFAAVQAAGQNTGGGGFWHSLFGGGTAEPPLPGFEAGDSGLPGMATGGSTFPPAIAGAGPPGAPMAAHGSSSPMTSTAPW